MVDCLKERVEAAETKWSEIKTSWEVQVKKLDMTRKALEESKAETEVLKKVLKNKEGRSPRQGSKSVRPRRTGRRSFATPTVSSPNLVAAMLTTSMSAFIGSRLSFSTWMCLRSPWMTWPRPQPDPLNLKAPTSYLKVVLLLTFMVTEGPLPRKDKLNLLVMRIVQLRRPNQRRK